MSERPPIELLEEAARQALASVITAPPREGAALCRPTMTSMVQAMLTSHTDTENKLELAIKENERLERENALLASHLERAGVAIDLDEEPPVAHVPLRLTLEQSTDLARQEVEDIKEDTESAKEAYEKDMDKMKVRAAQARQALACGSAQGQSGGAACASAAGAQGQRAAAHFRPTAPPARRPRARRADAVIYPTRTAGCDGGVRHAHPASEKGQL